MPETRKESILDLQGHHQGSKNNQAGEGAYIEAILQSFSAVLAPFLCNWGVNFV